MPDHLERIETFPMKHKNGENREEKVELVYPRVSPEIAAESRQLPERQAYNRIHRITPLPFALKDDYSAPVNNIL